MIYSGHVVICQCSLLGYIAMRTYQSFITVLYQLMQFLLTLTVHCRKCCNKKVLDAINLMFAPVG